jgi:hypothetical protein
MNAIVSHILTPKESKDTLSGVVALLGGFLGAKAQTGIQNSEWLGILQGRVEPPPQVAKVARMIFNMQDSPEMMDGLLSWALSWLNTQGFEEEKVLKALRDYSKVLGVTIDSPSIESVRNGLFELTGKIVDADDQIPTVHAVIDCPQCRYVFTV